jgi:hypothetical protein
VTSPPPAGVLRRSVVGPLHVLRRGFAEIEASPALHRFGALLALSHVVTLVFWTVSRDLGRLLGQSPESAICWPFFEDCWRLRPVPRAAVHAALVVYGALAVGGTVLFLGRRAWRRWLALGYVALCAMNLLKAALFVLDYRLMGNYHYMLFIISFAYLFWPAKALVCRLLIVGFYVSAGSLKLNAEWLSGAALLRPALFTGWLGDASLAYVVLLELVLVFGLLAENALVFYATFAQLVAFHIYSWHIVGYFYPCIMFCLLAIFPLCRTAGDDRGSSLGARLIALRLPRSSWAALALYAAAQLAPHLFPGDVALTGEGRIFALNMLDAKSECSVSLITTEGSAHTEHATLRPGLGVRTRCDPIVYFAGARGLCQALGGRGEVDLGLVSRRATDGFYRSIVSVTDLCGAGLGFDLWRHNAWIDP